MVKKKELIFDEDLVKSLPNSVSQETLLLIMELKDKHCIDKYHAKECIRLLRNCYRLTKGKINKETLFSDFNAFEKQLMGKD